jgi:ferredoxin--NADP+ reductase
MIGLEIEGRPLLRAYSIASANYEDELEFFSIKVPDGALTSQLQKVQPGDELVVTTKATGTLVAGFLKPAKHLYLLCSGTGLAPFMSIIKDPFIYDAFDKVILVHSVRLKSELAYKDVIENELPDNEFFGEDVRNKLLYYPTVTREEFHYQSVSEKDNASSHHKRITDLLTSGQLSKDLGMPDINVEDDRFMLCGNNDMLKDLMNILDDKGFSKANSRSLGEYVIEMAFLEK